MIKTCVVCAKEYVTYRKINSKYCSNDCKSTAHNKTIICKFCSVSFESVASSNKQFCSRKCQYAMGMSEETKHKISIAETGKKVSSEVVAKIAAKNKKFSLTKDELCALYWYGNKGINEIGILLNVDPVSVLYWLKKYDIPRRKRGNILHRKLSPEGRARISAANKGKKPCLGKKCSEETKKKISVSQKGKIISDEQRKKVSAVHKGTHRSEEFKKNVGLFMKGNTYNIGRKASEETKKKQSIIQKELHNTPGAKIKQSELALSLWKDAEYAKKVLSANNQRPNKYEKQLLVFIDTLFPGEWRYVGDGSLIINGKNPDFVNIENNKIIEFNGEYWHKDDSVEKINNRVILFKNTGYDTLFIWGKELRNKKELMNKIYLFMVS